MHLSAIVGGIALVLFVLWDALETIVFPRIFTRRLRFSRLFYRSLWIPLRALGKRPMPDHVRDRLLSVFGPISLLLLLIAWGCLLDLGYALMYWGAGTAIHAPADLGRFPSDLFFSTATLCTLSLGDLTPASRLERLFAVLEAANGFGFFAMVIGYFPVLSQAFSRREVNISLLDARAGSPPSAGELLIRERGFEGAETVGQLLEQWDRWAAEFLETHITFPVLAFYRSQHDNQSWVASLTTILDVCALILAGLEEGPVERARLTFATARHAAVDLSRLFRLKALPPEPDRLSPATLAHLRETLTGAGLTVRGGPEVDGKLARLRQMYEPHMNALGDFLLMPLPTWTSPQGARDNWLSTA